MPRYLTELVGTFLFVLVIALAVLSNLALAPVAIGVALMCVVYMGGHVSGGHYNPAVTVGVWLRGKLPARDVVPYVVAQIVGAVLATLAAKAILPGAFVPAPGAEQGVGAVLLAEILFTFFLVLVVLQTATNKVVANNSFYGFAIGGVVLAGAFVVGPVSGAVFNPAVGVGPILVDAIGGGQSFRHVWLYVVGPIVGALIAVGVFKLQKV